MLVAKNEDKTLQRGLTSASTNLLKKQNYQK